MKVRNHCGPAFPFEYHNRTSTHQESFATDTMLAPQAAEQYMGLSMRDYFAAKALQGMCSDPSTAGMKAWEVADECYKMADLMLIAGGHIHE